MEHCAQGVDTGEDPIDARDPRQPVAESGLFRWFASSVLDRTESLRYIRVRLASTVLTDMKSSAAVS